MAYSSTQTEEALGAGKTLLEHYASTDLVERLIGLGHLARVGKSLEDCISYSRDRGQLLAYYRDYPVESAKMVDARKSLRLASEKRHLDSRVLNERPSTEDIRRQMGAIEKETFKGDEEILAVRV